MKKTKKTNIVNYCPQCDDVPDKSVKTNGRSVFIARECSKHRFVKAGAGIMVSKVFLKKFKQMTRPMSISSQEI